ncbi:hypothetical protein ACFVDI_11740 [Nocardioides sp. NPDC057767]|uniref:hypothetical protein n=1 Tax=unclassified Nocardioides TaxID=2615069 RepID=UPI003671E0D7
MTTKPTTTGESVTPAHRVSSPPSRFVVAVGLVVALWCAGFAAISVWFELTDRFATGEYAEEADALSVMNWLVVVLKVLGVVVALLAIRPRPVAPRTTGLVLWGAFATVTVYVLGSIGQAVVILAGIAGDADDLDARSLAYVVGFLVAAIGFGILAISYARRVGLSVWVVILGVLGAPVVLGGVLVIAPVLLKAAGLL